MLIPTSADTGRKKFNANSNWPASLRMIRGMINIISSEQYKMSKEQYGQFIGCMQFHAKELCGLGGEENLDEDDILDKKLVTFGAANARLQGLLDEYEIEYLEPSTPKMLYVVRHEEYSIAAFYTDRQGAEAKVRDISNEWVGEIDRDAGGLYIVEIEMGVGLNIKVDMGVCLPNSETFK